MFGPNEVTSTSLYHILLSYYYGAFVANKQELTTIQFNSIQFNTCHLNRICILQSQGHMTTFPAFSGGRKLEVPPSALLHIFNARGSYITIYINWKRNLLVLDASVMKYY